jgi:hypothetical protein
MKRTGATMSRVCPAVYATSFCDQVSVVTNMTKPAPIISGPSRLSGRRHQATRPPKMYAATIQSASSAMISGSPSSTPIASFVSASTSEKAAAAHPAAATAEIATRFGSRARRGCASSAIAEAVIDSLLSALVG